MKFFKPEAGCTIKILRDSADGIHPQFYARRYLEKHLTAPPSPCCEIALEPARPMVHMNVLSAESDIERVAIPRKSWEQLVLAAGNMVRARQLQKKQRQFRINKAKLQDMRRLEVNGKLRIKRNRLQKNCL